VVQYCFYVRSKKFDLFPTVYGYLNVCVLQTVQQHIDLRDLVQHLNDGIDQETQEMVKTEENSVLLRDIFVSAVNSWCVQEKLTTEDLDAKLLAALNTFASYLASSSRLEAYQVLMSVLHEYKGRNALKLREAVLYEVRLFVYFLF
jgi:hypothetical protein